LAKKRVEERERLEQAVPTIAPPGDLAFTRETVQTEIFDLPVTVRMDPQTKMVSIRFSVLTPDRAVALSVGCTALLREDDLLGFEIRDIVEA
jgi:hypothetical protein